MYFTEVFIKKNKKEIFAIKLSDYYKMQNYIYSTIIFPYPIPIEQANLNVPFFVGVKSIVSCEVLTYFETPNSFIVNDLKHPVTLSSREILTGCPALTLISFG